MSLNNSTVQFTDVSPVYIVGTGRSGTTLLQLMLNAHPNLAIFGELHYFNAISQLKKEIPVLVPRVNFDQFLRRLHDVTVFDYLPGIENFLQLTRERLESCERVTYECFYKTLLEVYAETEGARRFGEKTPEYIRYLPDIFELFPKAKFLHIIRDPRAVVASAVKAPWGGPDVVSHSVKWKIENSLACDWGYNTNSYFQVRYEDLVAAPKATLERICDFLEEPFYDQMLEYNKTTIKYVKNEPWKMGTRRSVYSESLSKWQRELSSPRVQLIEFFCAPLFEEIGYERITVPLWSKVLVPITLLTELSRYGLFKVRDMFMRKTTNFHRIYGESGPLLSEFKRVFSRRKTSNRNNPGTHIG